MEALRGFLVKRERYKPPQPVLPWVPACEYQVVITVALLAMAGAYFALLNSIFQYFFGIHNKRAIDIVHSPNSSTSDQDDTELELEISDDHTKQPKNFEYRAYYCNMHLIINGVIPVFFAQGMLMFRVWCCYNRKIVKILHVIVLGITLPLGVLSLPFMSRWSNYLPSPVNGEHFWSLHAWMGMLFILLFAITFVSGIYIFFWKPYKDPYGSAELRSKFVPYHSFMGVALFIIAISQVVTGLTNYASAFTWDTWEATFVFDYHYYEHDYTRRISAIKMCLVFYVVSGGTVMYALSRDDFRHRGRIILTKDTEWTDVKK